MIVRPLLPRLVLVLLVIAAAIWVTGEADAIRYGLVALGLFAAIAVLPRLLRRMHDPLVWIEAGALKRQLETGQPVTVIDVRGPDEFIGPLGHIPAARNMPISGFENQIGELAGLERTPLVLVCRTDKRSAKAAKVLLGAGFARVLVLRGGMMQWHEDGMAKSSAAGFNISNTAAAHDEGGPLR